MKSVAIAQVVARPQAISRREVAAIAVSGCLAACVPWSAPGTTPDVSSYEPNRWRDQFPLLKQRMNGQPLAYLDSAATTQRPKTVIDALVEFYSQDNANPSATLHGLARRAYERYEGARRIVADFIGAKDTNEVVWVRGTTEAINLVAASWGRVQLRAGDEILLTIAEHASNLLPWRLVAQQTGSVVRYVKVDESGRLLVSDLEEKLSARTRLLAFSHVSNVTGYVNPAADICARARRVGARVLIDAAQSVPHVPVNVHALDCDFLAFSGHKMLGPMGIGVLWARRELLDGMRPYQAGSNMAHDVDTSSEELESGARRFGAGTPNVSGPVGLAAAIRFLQSMGRDAVERHEAELTAHGLAKLRQIRRLRLLGPTEPDRRLPVFSFSMQNRTPFEVMQRLDAQGIAVRAGDLAALPLLEHFGVNAAIRASCYCYTELEEIDRLARALTEIADEARRA